MKKVFMQGLIFISLLAIVSAQVGYGNPNLPNIPSPTSTTISGLTNITQILANETDPHWSANLSNAVGSPCSGGTKFAVGLKADGTFICGNVLQQNLVEVDPIQPWANNSLTIFLKSGFQKSINLTLSNISTLGAITANNLCYANSTNSTGGACGIAGFIESDPKWSANATAFQTCASGNYSNWNGNTFLCANDQIGSGASADFSNVVFLNKTNQNFNVSILFNNANETRYRDATTRVFSGGTNTLNLSATNGIGLKGGFINLIAGLEKDIIIKAGDASGSQSGKVYLEGGISDGEITDAPVIIGLNTIPVFAQSKNSLSVGDVFEVAGLSYFSSIANVKAGASTTYAKVGGTFFYSTTSSSSNGGTDVQLASYTLPAKILNTNGQTIEIKSGGQLGGDIGTMDLTLKIAGCTLFDTAGFTGGLSGYDFSGEIIRFNSTSVQSTFTLMYGDFVAFPEVKYAECGVNTTSTALLNLTGTGAVGADINFKYWKGEWKP